MPVSYHRARDKKKAGDSESRRLHFFVNAAIEPYAARESGRVHGQVVPDEILGGISARYFQDRVETNPSVIVELQV